MNLDTQTILIAFGLTLIAGLSTGIGSLIAFCAKKTNQTFLTVSLGFSAGVMLFVSFVDIFPAAEEAFAKTLGDNALLGTMLAFFGGMFLIAIIDLLIPEQDNPHEAVSVEDMNKLPLWKKMTHRKHVHCHHDSHHREHCHHHHADDSKKLRRVGILVAFSIAIHNFPEGLATFAVGLQGVKVALPIVIAIALHNIPEGIAVAVPIYQATGKKRKAFWLSLLSGLSEPLGALIGYFILLPFWSPTVEGALMALTAGIMVYISLDELLPTAERYGKHHYAIIGVVAGMMFMAFSILMLH
ncbi:MAG TPA: zinc transporter ZupT [Paludibacteraceae bacterium]|nr:zinc transporter ZupT [Paludibacteraceae bacterium]HQB68708.1 zinc transporter ZupT [Paludibacteraceae bacterium]HRS67259.1 zinc transporter ZupT [Paludibacteraceae bacterium]